MRERRTPTIGSVARRTAVEPEKPALRNGDRLTQKQFHLLYENTPTEFKAELIGGVVYVSSPLRKPHGKHGLRLVGLFAYYEGSTPGVEGFDNATVIIDDKNEPQPDVILRILPERGGQSGSTDDDYLTGPPELLAQVADTTKKLDLGRRLEQYREAGVIEYVVVVVPDRRVYWFDLKRNRPIEPDAKGVLRSRVFPGLWILGPGLFEQDQARRMDVLQAGLASPEHARFVKRLQGRPKKR